MKWLMTVCFALMLVFVFHPQSVWAWGGGGDYGEDIDNGEYGAGPDGPQGDDGNQDFADYGHDAPDTNDYDTDDLAGDDSDGDADGGDDDE